MSVQALSWVLDNSESEHAARLVLISIANHCDKIGLNAWPSVQAIGSEARLCERIVRSAIAELETLGELTVERGAGPHRTNLYGLPKMLGAKNTPAKNAGAEFPAGVQSLPVEGAKLGSVIRKNRPEPSLEPSLRESIIAWVKTFVRTNQTHDGELNPNIQACAAHLAKELKVSVATVEPMVEEAFRAQVGVA